MQRMTAPLSKARRDARAVYNAEVLAALNKLHATLQVIQTYENEDKKKVASRKDSTG